MRAVIFAVMLFTVVTTWLAYDVAPQSQPTAVGGEKVEQVGLRTRYRLETADCDRENTSARHACERRARERILGKLRQEAAQLYFR